MIQTTRSGKVVGKQLLDTYLKNKRKVTWNY